MFQLPDINGTIAMNLNKSKVFASSKKSKVF